MEIGAELVVRLASVLFSTALSAAKDGFQKRKQRAQREERSKDNERATEKDNAGRGASGGGAAIEIQLELGPDGVEDVGVAVAMELAMKASRKLFGWRPRRNEAFKGLSADFAAHRRETHLELSEMTANQQSASQAIAEELVGVRGDLRYSADQLTRGVASVRTDLGTLIEKVDGIWNDVETGLLEVNYAVRQGTTVIYRSLEDLRGDMSEMRESMDEARAENFHYFTEVASRLDSLEANIRKHHKQQNRRKLQNSLRKAKMHLNNFTGAGGEDFGNLDKARDCCIKILSLQPESDTLDAQFMAGVIAIATSYTKVAQQKSPATGKRYVFDADFLNITHSFKSVWADPSAAHDSNWTAVVTYLLDMASAICILPPEGVLLPHLDPQLVEAFGKVCSSQPSLLDRFPEVGGAALRALLQAKPLHELCRVSTALEVDTSLCDNKVDVIQALFDERKPMDAVLNHTDPQIDQGEPSSDGGGVVQESKEDEEETEDSDEDEPQSSIGSSHGSRGPPRSHSEAGLSGSGAGFEISEDEGSDKPTEDKDQDGPALSPTRVREGASGGHAVPWWFRDAATSESDDDTIASFKLARESF